MTITKPIFWEYLLFSDNGEIIGIEKDAPEEAKEDFYNYAEMQKRARTKNICGSLDFDVLVNIYKAK